MVRTYKRKTDRQSWSEESMEHVIKDVKSAETTDVFMHAADGIIGGPKFAGSSHVQVEQNIERQLCVTIEKYGPYKCGASSQSRYHARWDLWGTMPLSPGLKLAITLIYLATGDSNKSLAYGFRVATNTVVSVVREVCEVIYDHYKSRQASQNKRSGRTKLVCHLVNPCQVATLVSPTYLLVMTHLPPQAG